jgi:glucosyl-3-phosphoglycerate synthase
VQKLGIVPKLPEMSTYLRQFQVHDQVFESVEHEIVEEERPPMNTIPEYKEQQEAKRAAASGE